MSESEAAGQTAETLNDAGKLHVVDAARLLGDNQKTLNHVNAEDARMRDLYGRVEEAMAREKHPGLALPNVDAKEDEMKINIDSPVTVHHNYPVSQPSNQSPTRSIPKRSLLSKAAPLLLAGAMGSGIGIPAAAGVAWALGAFDKKTTPAVIDTDTHREWEIIMSGGEQ